MELAADKAAASKEAASLSGRNVQGTRVGRRNRWREREGGSNGSEEGGGGREWGRWRRSEEIEYGGERGATKGRQARREAWEAAATAMAVESSDFSS